MSEPLIATVHPTFATTYEVDFGRDHLSPRRHQPITSDMNAGHLPMIRNNAAVIRDERPISSMSRVDALEARMRQQERATAELLEKAIRVKDDFNSNMSTVSQRRNEANELTREHINVVTDLIKKLTSDYQSLDERMRQNAGGSEAADRSFREMEMSLTRSVADVRGKLARSDNHVARITQDLKDLSVGFAGARSKQEEFASKTNQHLHSFDTKTERTRENLEKSLSELTNSVKQSQRDNERHASALEMKIKRQLDDTTRSLQDSIASIEQNISRMTQEMSAEKTAIRRDFEERQIQTEQKMTGRLEKLERSMETLMQQLVHSRQERTKDNDDLQNRVRTETHSALGMVRKECVEGFEMVHEGLDSMKKLLDSRRELSVEQLRKEINSLRKSIVVL